MIGVRQFLRRLDRFALPLGLLGLLAVALHNWRQWQKDKALLAQKGNPPPRPPLAEWPHLPLISVLVAAWNEADFIERHIESFLSLRYPHKELVLCAGGSDNTYELACQYVGERVKVLEQAPGEGKQRALARAFPHTRGDIIFLTDADCLLDDDAFERTLYPVASGGEQVCTGSSRPLPEQLENPFVISQAASQFYSSLHMPDYVSGLLGRNCAIRRDLLQYSRGLEVPAPTGTDYVLAVASKRNGIALFNVEHSRMQSCYPTSVSKYLRQQRRWLKNVLIIGSEAGDWPQVRSAIITIAMGVFFLFGGLFSLTSSFSTTVWLTALSAALVNRLRYIRVTQVLLGCDAKMKAFDLLRYFFVDVVAWTAVFFDLARSRETRKW